MYPQYVTYTSQHSRQGGISSSQGGSSRDVADAASAVVAGAEAKEVGAEDAYAPHMLQAVFHNLSPSLEGHSKDLCQWQIQVELPLRLPVDMPLPEEDNTAQSTPTKINSTTTGTCVTLMALMSRMVTRQQCVNGGRWTTRRASHVTTRRATLTRDMLLAREECIKMCCQQTSDSVGQR
jgi:hypothetical protein